MQFENAVFRVRELNERDANDLFTRYCGVNETAKYISTLPHDNAQTTRLKIKHWRQFYQQREPKLSIYGVSSRHDDRVFGLVVFIFNPEYAEIHFGISNQYSNQGIATQLCLAGLQYLKTLGITDVRTNPYVAHAASIRVLEKSGFIQHGTLENYAPFPALGEGLFNCADMRIQL